jgi:recombination protein RecA
VSAPVKIVARKSNPIDRVVGAVAKNFGAASLARLKTGVSIPIAGVYSTGFETIDHAWGRGGMPRGRATILHGKEGCGKTTVALTTAAHAQRAGALVVYVDAEYKLDLLWAARCGLNLDDVVLSQPDYLEQAIGIIGLSIERAAAEGMSVYAVIDSMNACDTKAESEADWDAEIHYGPKAKAYSRLLPKLMKTVKMTDSVLVLVSQTRSGPQGNHIACGNAPKFHSSSIAQFSKPAQGHRVKVGENVVAVDLQVEFTKNQVSQAYRKARFRIAPNGPDWDHGLLEVAATRGLISKSGAGWIEWPRSKGQPLKFQGTSGWAKLLKKRPELADELKTAVRTDYEGTGNSGPTSQQQSTVREKVT